MSLGALSADACKALGVVCLDFGGLQLARVAQVEGVLSLSCDSKCCNTRRPAPEGLETEVDFCVGWHECLRSSVASRSLPGGMYPDSRRLPRGGPAAL